VTDRDPIDRDAWARVGDLFHRAVELPTEAREAFVAGAADDDDVRREVLSLLVAHDRATDFIEASAARIDATDVPDRIGSYLIRGVLGEGGMGVVYLAEDSRLGRTVALKAVAPQFVGDPARRERLRREARAAASLHHPGIATIFALEEIDGHLYIAGEYVPGETLRDELDRGPIAPARAVDTMLAVARALTVAHERGVIHRDLKPENLMRTPAGEVKILDFGLARIHDPSSTAAAAPSGDGRVLGTPAYMAPEQIRGTAVDARADLFALGVVLYELVTGVNPFAGRDPASTIARILQAEPERLHDRAPAAAPAIAIGLLERVVHTCLRKRAEDRFRSARELVAALEAAHGALAGMRPAPAFVAAAEPAPPSGRALWWWKFHQAAASIGYALLLVPLWRLRDFSEPLGTPLFVGGLVGATAAGAIRLHSWFAADLDRARWRREHRQSTPWRLTGDALVTGVLAAEGIIALLARETWGILLVAASAAVLVAFAVVEPATTRAAFEEDSP
jgi:serine/threonine protein kinase